jgi:holo-[acyl-carrier protein] synthase
MHVIGHGIDVVPVRFIQEELASPQKQWAQRFCSPLERAQADPSPLDARYYAGRFAAKEAVVKALGTGFSGDVTWRGIEILRRETGAPYVRLSGDVLEFADELGVTGWFVSISHCGELTTASAIAVGDCRDTLPGCFSDADR